MDGIKSEDRERDGKPPNGWSQKENKRVALHMHAELTYKIWFCGEGNGKEIATGEVNLATHKRMGNVM